MTSQLLITTGRLGYGDVVRHVVKHGERRAPRGLPTLDAGFVTVEVADPTDMLPLSCGRRVSRKVAAAEAVQLVGAFSHPQLLVAAASRFADYVEPDTGRFHGAYGERIKHQLAAAVTKLRSDADSRQAVITLWNPWLDNLPGKLDYPCTVALHLALVRDRLELNVTMRSSDVWRGIPYDLFQFSTLQQTAARLLDVESGTYRHTAWSLHIYESDLPRVDELVTPADARPETQPAGFGVDGCRDPYAVISRARGVALTRVDAAAWPDLTNSERWYLDALPAT